MPSMHAAFTVSLCTVLILGEGIGPASAVAMVFTLLTLNDALMLRRQVGDHAKVLNRLVETLPDDAEYSYPILAVRVGHTFAEIVAGGALGAALALLLWGA
jgi:acid phosphatase family membrane protein YuiD